MNLSQEIRRKFLHYFKEKGHAIIPSSPVVPHDDPTLLFTNAGMNQFKDVFLGSNQREYKRASTAQKCIRVGGKHNDLDNVGHTSRHLTFFEMLGNFSFGDYFKEKAIEYAWEVTNKVFGFDPDHLWITVFETDDEAAALWEKWVSPKRIVRLGEKDNFWAMGETGPCGPCSELYYDRGKNFGDAKHLKDDVTGERYLEFWNLVFMQFNRDANGKMLPLPNQSVDTGAGLERVVSLKMGVDNVFLTDILRHLIAQVEKVSKKKYRPEDLHLAPAFHVIADHVRSLSFAIADGAQPSNIERGYVLRKLIRRASRYGKSLELNEPFLAKILPALVEMMGADYPELKDSQGRVEEILTLEEESFLRTLKRGGNILGTIIEEARKDPLKQISGEDAFKLKDTYGFPLEEVLLIAKDTGLQVNLDSYQLLEEQAKERSRSAQTTHAQEAEESHFKNFVAKHPPARFVGYGEKECDAHITGIVVNGQFVESLSQGQEALILLDQTPFYAEKGGQVGDVGTIVSGKSIFKVQGCKNPYPGVIAHIGTLEHGFLKVGEKVFAQIDAQRRQLIANHHTATHLLHWALQHVLGAHIRQAGSLVEPTRLRFDFNHHKALSPEEIYKIESLVNEKIRENKCVSTYELSFDEAQKHPDIKQFFGEKYGAQVRVVDIDFSKELCGGTHVSELGSIGYFRIVKEGGIAAGVRRIEAVTGRAAEEFVHHTEETGQAAATLLKTTVAQLPEKLSLLLEENQELKHQLKTFKRSGLKQLAKDLSEKITLVGSTPLITEIVSLDAEELPLLADELFQLNPSLLLILAAKHQERCQLFIRVSQDLVKKGVHAGQLIKEIAPLIGGMGGGKADSAQAGGKDPNGVHQAFKKAKELLSK